MIDHIGLAVSDVERSRAFYAAALAPLGYRALQTLKNDLGNDIVMMGDHEPFFVIAGGERVGEGNHVAFRAATRAQVDAFHAAALAAGGKDNGGPGLRPQYHENYYAAFVHDPDGMNIEAVCHTPA